MYWQTIAMLKADPQTRDIPIIVLSASDNRELGFQMGVMDYLVKPIDRNALLTALSKVSEPRIEDVLVVDDDPMAVDLLSEMLEMSGVHARRATNGAEALAEIEKAPPDAILLDLMMPVMDGFEVIDRLQNNPGWCDIPVVVITAKELTAEERVFLNDRVSQVVEKGRLDPDRLGQAFKEMLRRYHGA